MKNHEQNEKYSDNFDKVVSIMDTDKLSPQGCFDQIKRRFENIILLTLSTEIRLFLLFIMRNMETEFWERVLQLLVDVDLAKKPFQLN